MQKTRTTKPRLSFAASLLLLFYMIFTGGRFSHCSPRTGPTNRDRLFAAGVSCPGMPDPHQESETIIHIAKSQIGRGPKEVGKELKHHPYNLSRQLRRNEQWCSEFVSWVYCAAGTPLRGGRRGWLLRNSRSLREWFQQNSFFVRREDDYWENNAPIPGDYIRYNNDRGGHSGLVYLVEGSTLVTIEGNINDRVVVKRLKNWRTRDDIDGIGLKSAPSTASYREHRINPDKRKVNRTRQNAGSPS